MNFGRRSRSRSPSDGYPDNTPDDAIATKRSYRKRLEHDWTHEDTLKLIELWGNEESTYNKRSMAYREKGERMNAYKRISRALEEYGISVSTDEVYSKMHSLRVYYSATSNKAKAAKLKNGTDDEARVTWPYYEKMSFLKDNMNPRGPTVKDVEEESDDSNQFEVTQAKSVRPSIPVYISTETLPPGATAYVPNGGQYGPEYQEQWSRDEQSENTDDLFCRMLAIQLKELPRQTREVIKHEISGLLLKARFPGSCSKTNSFSSNK